ncbi:restriction endonuclease subunit S [Escherichia coli]|uniref:restriction endonuclease subunit S n=1 Tax=Escherichia coli TaxID=562 RepID=UPI001C9AE218|nr:restriction endonuclease subunit S [Escherichia coli]MBY7180413.1 restriction endonuclease subunit S [Escherichia coli]MBY7255895.1 restriction endonuclease subunit S [Escherichia coli]MBY7270803.1 restriction endonuclease subunit S [Escherichia coli]MBY7375665.1 restriction endonuclease subunit S [Escherichia coli]MBY7397317.1 restriction endonuclease subunit S [Escherichia coli]
MAGLNKYQAYPEYRDSGVEWLGEIPYQWKLSQVKHIAPFQVGWTPSTKNDANFIGNNLWVNISDLQGKFISSTAKCISDQAAKESSMEMTPRGSLLYSFKLSVGAISFADCDLYTNEAIASFLNKAELPLSYLYYALPKFIIENSSTNIYGAKILNQELIRNAFLLTPSHNEAEKIADFLDHETAKIDNLIEKQQQLIELLKEKRQAVISHAVTKGLSPDVPMKDSGVEWLGEIPSHWEMKKLAYLGSARNGLTYSPESITDNESGILVLRSSNIQNSCLRFDDNVYVKAIIPEQFLVKENDLLICSRNGSRNLIGKNALINKEAEGMAFGAFMAIFRSNINKYLFWVLNSTLFDYQSGSFLTSTINQLTIGNLNSMEVPVPPSKEQKEIESHLSKKIMTLSN